MDFLFANLGKKERQESEGKGERIFWLFKQHYVSLSIQFSLMYLIFFLSLFIFYFE